MPPNTSTSEPLVPSAEAVCAMRTEGGAPVGQLLGACGTATPAARGRLIARHCLRLEPLPHRAARSLLAPHASGRQRSVGHAHPLRLLLSFCCQHEAFMFHVLTTTL